MHSQPFSATDHITPASARVNVEPRLGKRARSLLRAFTRKVIGSEDYGELSRLREIFLQKTVSSGREGQALRVAIGIVFDLKVQGWTLEVSRKAIYGQPPRTEGGSPAEEKQRLRQTHLHERNNQLRKHSVREFIRRMEQQHLGPHGWVSIFSVMRDGHEFEQRLRLLAGRNGVRSEDLKGCISPYIQVVEAGARCSLTGMKLSEIWRYFRHTWTTPYNGTPGRKIWILVRDRAAENHPVIGIAAIGSAVVQLSTRDAWIGWRSGEFLEQMRLNPSARWAHWVERWLNTLIDGIYKKDFLAERILTASSLRHPDEATIARLLGEGAKARKRHQKYPRRGEHKGGGRNPLLNWSHQSCLDLFRAKRADSLAKLLGARLELREAGFGSDIKSGLREALKSAQGRRAIEIILKQVKATHVGIDMLDITVCGSVAPYNHILGGKLVSLLLTSPEIVRAYARRYSRSPSIIASSMAGRAVRRKPRLVLLATTGLYRVNPSQYNRLHLPAGEVGGSAADSIRFERLGESEGFGSYHLSSETAREVDILLAQSHPGTRVNSIFGEGVNPKLRKLRAGLDLLGLDSNALLNHRSSRVVYGIPLASNFREILLGVEKRPRYFLPQKHPQTVTNRIADFWMRRWLAQRISHAGILEATAAHSVAHPVSHGARVVLPLANEGDVQVATYQSDATTLPEKGTSQASAHGMITVS
jgi:Druantia protein DruA